MFCKQNSKIKKIYVIYKFSDLRRQVVQIHQTQTLIVIVRFQAREQLRVMAITVVMEVVTNVVRP